MNEDELTTAALLKLMDAIEDGITEAKHLISKAKDIETWNPSRIKWTQTEGPKGAYERSVDTENPEFKAMLNDLEVHDGKLTRDGFFYWKFSGSPVVGRKKLSKHKEVKGSPKRYEFPDEL